MVIRRPIVLNEGFPGELPSGELIDSSQTQAGLLAGSGLYLAGDGSTQEVGYSLAAAPSGLIFVENAVTGKQELGNDGVVLVQSQAAYASGVAAEAAANTALDTNNDALSTANQALASGNAALEAVENFTPSPPPVYSLTAGADIQEGDVVGVDEAGQLAPVFNEAGPGVRSVVGNGGFTFGPNDQTLYYEVTNPQSTNVLISNLTAVAACVPNKMSPSNDNSWYNYYPDGTPRAAVYNWFAYVYTLRSYQGMTTYIFQVVVPVRVKDDGSVVVGTPDILTINASTL